MDSLEDGRKQKIEAQLFAVELGGTCPEFDLHGFYPNEAGNRIDIFLSEHTLHAPCVVRIIYGKGEGKMRKAALDFLRGHPLIERVVEKEGSCLIVLDT